MQSPRIFISYSHHGNGPGWKAALIGALEVFDRQNLLDVWEDGRIRAGAHWAGEIEEAIDSASLAVVLLTKEALESEYILRVELPRLQKRRERDRLPVFPVVCEPCDWQAHPWLREIQMPNASQPLGHLPAERREQAFRELAVVIAETLSSASLAAFSPPIAGGGVAPVESYLDKFPLNQGPGLRPDKMLGREQELALLDLAFAQPATAVACVVAWGGVGKSMLVQHWLQRLRARKWCGMHRVYAWSFHSQGVQEDRQASEELFLAHALEWFGVRCEPTLSSWDKACLLANAVHARPTLLILDGIEPLQYPPGPLGGQLRAPGIQSLLKQLVRKAAAEGRSGLCLVTSREPLTDLADFQRREGSPWGNVLRIDLGNLTGQAGAAVLHHNGANRAGAAELQPGDAELLAASREVGGHALTLHLLGRFLARAHAGDIRRRDLVNFEEADLTVQGGTTFRMLRAFERWLENDGEIEARALAILRLLGLFDGPAEAACVKTLRAPPAIPHLTASLFASKPDSGGGAVSLQPLSEGAWNYTVHFLVDFGLVALGHSEDRLWSLDCHPLIREHFAKAVRSEHPASWCAAHSRLYHHLKDSTPPLPSTLEGLQPLYQAVAHGCKAGLHLEARTAILRDRIQREDEYFSIRQLGATGEELSALSCFFEEPWESIVATLPPNEQALIYNQTAYCLRALGRIGEAPTPCFQGLEIAAEAGDWRESANHADNLGQLFTLLGQLQDAFHYETDAWAYAQSSTELRIRILTRSALAEVCHHLGNHQDALNGFFEAESIQASEFPEMPLLYSISGYRYCRLLLENAERQAWQTHMGAASASGPGEPAWIICNDVRERAQATLAFARARKLSPLTQAFDHLTLACADLFQMVMGAPSPSIPPDGIIASNITAAMDGLRRAQIQDCVPQGLLPRAWLRCIEGSAAAARTDLDEAWDIASRGPMRLHQCDIHLYRARLFFREKTYPWSSPADDLAAAEKLIADCGYLRRAGELADAKQAIL